MLKIQENIRKGSCATLHRDHFATISPPLRELVRYNKISLEPGETKTVSFTVDMKN